MLQHVYYVDEMAAVLADLGPAALHLLSGTNTDSGRKTPVRGCAHGRAVTANPIATPSERWTTHQWIAEQQSKEQSNASMFKKLVMLCIL